MNSVELFIGLLINIVVGWVFYRLGERKARQQADDLKTFIGSELVPYANQLRHAINALEGKNVEDEGRIVVDHDPQGNPTTVRIASPQTIVMEGVPSEEAVGVPAIVIGPPPTPPQSVAKDLSLNWRVHEAPHELDEDPSSGDG